MSLDESDNEERTIFVGNLNEKVTQDLLTELFLQVSPLERVSIPKESKDGKNKTYGFVTYKHRIAVPYALNIFSGTKLFGRELLLKNRSTSSNNNSNRNSFSNPSTPVNSLTQIASNPLLNAISDHSMMPNIGMMSAISFEQQQQQYLQQQLFNQQIIHLANASAMKMFNQHNLETNFPSTFSDQMGSQRERDLVDRNRHHRHEDRNTRNKPYNRRSHSRSPLLSHQRNRSRSPHNRRDKDRDRRRDDRGYHKWNYRK
ncbi:hypothetical protein PVAND_004351 [Polypedilum vanderplanki]|uniref:RRM domain-containing protein n=1 Tax=Polypedilum vanderplanki TaxID=319348 RepID=A0A9J6BWQ3_POLVA|nr:hypothetical protein PVAND_004351 [Polypedilum vanderplanki]